MMPTDRFVVVCPKCGTLFVQHELSALHVPRGLVLFTALFALPLAAASLSLLLSPILSSDRRLPVLAVGVALGAVIGTIWAVQRPRSPSELELLGLAASRRLGPEDEREVRLRAFWAANDPHRSDEDAKSNGDPSLAPQREHNLRRLLELLESDPSESSRLLAGEILRHLRDFDGAARLLADPFHEQDLQEAADYLTLLAAKRNHHVQSWPDKTRYG